MYYHIIPQNSEKILEISEEKMKKYIEIMNFNINNCKIYSSNKSLEEIASIYEHRRIERFGDTINGLYTRENAIELDSGREFIKDITFEVFNDML